MAIDDFSPAKRGSYDWHSRLSIDFHDWRFPVLKTGDHEVKVEIARTGLVPLWYAPFLLCPPISIPPLATPALTREGKKLGTCLNKWTTAIIDTLGNGTLEPRRPDTWPKSQSDDGITAEWLLPWEELRRWAQETHGVSIGELPSLDETADTAMEAPAVDTTGDSASEAETRPNTDGWPYTHDTRLLAAVRWVIETYWENQDPGDVPNKDHIIIMLKTKFSLSKNEAEAVDLVTRHDRRRSQGR